MNIQYPFLNPAFYLDWVAPRVLSIILLIILLNTNGSSLLGSNFPKHLYCHSCDVLLQMPCTNSLTVSFSITYIFVLVVSRLYLQISSVSLLLHQVQQISRASFFVDINDLICWYFQNNDILLLIFPMNNYIIFYLFYKLRSCNYTLIFTFKDFDGFPPIVICCLHFLLSLLSQFYTSLHFIIFSSHLFHCPTLSC